LAASRLFQVNKDLFESLSLGLELKKVTICWFQNYRKKVTFSCNFSKDNAVKREAFNILQKIVLAIEELHFPSNGNLQN